MVAGTQDKLQGKLNYKSIPSPHRVINSRQSCRVGFQVGGVSLGFLQLIITQGWVPIESQV